MPSISDHPEIRVTSPSHHGRVALVATPGGELYGSDRMAVATVVALRAAGWGVVVTMPETGPLADTMRRAGARVEICPTARLRKSALRPLGTARLGIELLLSLRRSWGLLRAIRPTVVYVNTVTVPSWLGLARAQGIPTICHVHEAEASASRTLLRLVNLPLHLATELVMNSQFSRDVLALASGALARRSRVIYNAVPRPDVVQDPRPNLDGGCRVLFVGRLIPRKGAHVAIESIDILRRAGRDAALDVVGSPSWDYPGYEEHLNSRVEALGLADVVTFHGFDPDVWPYMAKTDIAIVPSTLPEPFGNTAVEAAMAARPRVVSDHPGLREATRHMSGVIRVPPNDARALADGVATVIDEWESARDQAAGDAKTAAEMYSTDRYAAEVVASFEQLRQPASRQ